MTQISDLHLKMEEEVIKEIESLDPGIEYTFDTRSGYFDSLEYRALLCDEAKTRSGYYVEWFYDFMLREPITDDKINRYIRNLVYQIKQNQGL